MTALKKEIFELVKKEALYMAALFLAALLIFKIVFYKEVIAVLLRTLASIFWLFALPGYFIMLHWHEKLNFLERFIIGAIAAASAIGIASYYLGIFGLNIKYHAILLPLALLAAGFGGALLKKSNHTSP